MSTRTADNRRSDRRKLWLPVMLVSSDGEHLGILHDVSATGVMAVTATIFSLGATVTLTFRIPPDEAVERTARGMVVRMGRNTEDPDGLWPRRVGIALDEGEAMLAALAPLLTSGVKR